MRSVAGGVVIKGCSFPSGKVEIPAAVNGQKVVAVMDYAFSGQKGMAEIVIPIASRPSTRRRQALHLDKDAYDALANVRLQC